MIEIKFHVSGATEAIVFPAKSPVPARTDKLWEQTCFELFVTPQSQINYWEYNLSPSLNWATFGFTQYRQSKNDEASIKAISINTQWDNQHGYHLQSVVPLPEALYGKKLQLGVSAVIQDRQNTIYYYALTHQKQTPDFHDRKSFILSLSV